MTPALRTIETLLRDGAFDTLQVRQHSTRIGLKYHASQVMMQYARGLWPCCLSFLHPFKESRYYPASTPAPQPPAHAFGTALVDAVNRRVAVSREDVGRVLAAGDVLLGLLHFEQVRRRVAPRAC